MELWPEPDPAVEVTVGFLGFLGRMDGAGSSGTPDASVPSNVQATPPGPITMVSVLDWAFVVVVVNVVDKVENLERVVGTKVSVTVTDPTFDVITVCPA